MKKLLQFMESDAVMIAMAIFYALLSVMLYRRCMYVDSAFAFAVVGLHACFFFNRKQWRKNSQEGIGGA